MSCVSRRKQSSNRAFGAIFIKVARQLSTIPTVGECLPIRRANAYQLWTANFPRTSLRARRAAAYIVMIFPVVRFEK
jgi:hypothetical protein